MGIDRGRYFVQIYYLSSLLSLTQPFDQTSLMLSSYFTRISDPENTRQLKKNRCSNPLPPSDFVRKQKKNIF